MMGLGGNFWDKFSANTSNLDDILKKEDAKIEELLDDDNVISELKNLNPRLLNYLTTDKIKELIKYIIEEPQNGDDKNKAYKYPFVSSELLICESSTILDAFFVKPKLSQDNDSLHLDSDNDSSEKIAPLTNTKFNDDFADFQSSSKDDENVTESKPEGDQPTESKQEAKGEAENDKKKDEEEKHDDEKDSDSKKGEEKPTEQNLKEVSDTLLLDYLFSFINVKGEINVTLAGYFNKILSSFFNKRQIEAVSFIYKRKNIIDDLIYHIKYRSIAEVLLKLITFENSQVEDKYLDERKSILSKLIDNLTPESDPDVLSNIQLIISEVLGKNHLYISGRELVSYLFSAEIVKQLVACLFKENNPLLFGVTNIFAQFIQFINNENKKDKDEDEDQNQAPIEINLDAFYNTFQENVNPLIQRLKQNNKEKLKTTFGDDIGVFGTGKMKLIEVLGSLIRLEKTQINKELAIHKFPELLMEFFIEYQWNNMLHLQTEKILTYIWESDAEVELRNELLNEDRFLDFLISASSKNTYEFVNAKKRKTKAGYLGHLNKICNNFIKIAEKKENLKPLLESEKFKNLKKSYLDKANEGESKDLGGYNRNSSANNDDTSIEFDKDAVVEKNKQFLEAKQDWKDFDPTTSWHQSNNSSNQESWQDPFKELENNSGQNDFNAGSWDQGFKNNNEDDAVENNADSKNVNELEAEIQSALLGENKVNDVQIEKEVEKMSLEESPENAEEKKEESTEVNEQK